jgi:hypothetical protein
MELRSIVSGILLLFAFENLAPFAGIKISLVLVNPWLAGALGVGAVVLAYVLLSYG